MSTPKDSNSGGLIKLPQNSTANTSSQRRQDGPIRKKPTMIDNHQSRAPQSHRNSIQVLLDEARQIEKQLSKIISRRPTAQSSQLIFRYR